VQTIFLIKSLVLWSQSTMPGATLCSKDGEKPVV